jgi:hypothetical protein
MKKLIQTLTLVFFAAILTACGDGPDKTAKTFFEELFSGDASKAAELVYLPPEAAQAGMTEEAMKGKLSMAAAEMQQQIKKSDGKISVSTGEVTYTNADKTEARVTVIFKGKKDGNEQEKSQKVSVIKTGQGWKIKM